jgi:hypothetical protein
MSLGDMKEGLEGLPFKKNASPAQMLLLLGAIGFVLVTGMSAGIFAWDSRNTVVKAIEDVDAKVSSVKQSQEWMRKSTVSRAEWVQWTVQFDQANRSKVQNLVVPIPAIEAASAAPAPPPSN